MEKELTDAINRLAAAHERLAGNVGRLADSFTHVDGRTDVHSFADAVVWQAQQISNAIEAVAEKLPDPPES